MGESVANILSLVDEDEAQEPVSPEITVVDEISVVAPANRYLYALAFGKLEAKGYKPNEVMLNPIDFADFRVFEPPFDEQDCDGVEGVRGSLWGMTLVTTTLRAHPGVVCITGTDKDGNLNAVVRLLISR